MSDAATAMALLGAPTCGKCRRPLPAETPPPREKYIRFCTDCKQKGITAYFKTPEVTTNGFPAWTIAK